MSKIWSRNQKQFQVWLALPKYERFPPTHELLAPEIGVCNATLSRWKKQDGWNEAVNDIARNAVGEHLPEVYGALLREAEKGEIQHIRTVLELTGEMSRAGTGDNPLTIRFAWQDMPDDDDS